MNGWTKAEDWRFTHPAGLAIERDVDGWRLHWTNENVMWPAKFQDPEDAISFARPWTFKPEKHLTGKAKNA